MCKITGDMSSPAPGTTREEDANLSEPLLANGDGGLRVLGMQTTVIVGNARGGDARAEGAVKAQDRYWEDVPQPDETAAADLESGGRPLLFSKKKVKAIILFPYRALILVRLIAVILFIGWRINHKKSNVMWFWVMSVIADVYFAFSWLLYQLPKLNPIKMVPDLIALREHFDHPNGSSSLPSIDVFVTTADPVDEPVLYTMNCVLSILATDYPVDRYTCYLSDDSGALILYEALVKVANFATLWVPFCRKHSIEPRAPERYFQQEQTTYTGRSSGEFINDYKHVQREYEELKKRLQALPSTIQKRSDVYNKMEANEGHEKATWMADGTEWPGTWVDPTVNHNKGHHEGIVKIVQDHPGRKPQMGPQGSNIHPLNFDAVDGRLPMLVYVARGKSPCYEHNKKAGNLNAQLRVSALLTNAPFVISFDCDHYINNSQALRAAMCFMLDSRQGDDTGFVQFPQRFENVDPTDRYGNHNRVFFDGAMYALNGLQGPCYLGTGCMFRRHALYGNDPPSWNPNNMASNRRNYGDSLLFLHSLPLDTLKQKCNSTPPKLDKTILVEAMNIVSSSYDDGTDWGRGIGYVYKIATEDMVTGFRIHRQGWRSMYCTMEVDAFRGTAPINLTERLFQIIRWAAGSLEMFFSHNNPLLAGRRLHPMQQIMYLNYNIYPCTSLFVLLYSFCPLIWFIPDEILIQRPFTRYILYVIIIIGMIHIIGIFEIKWSGNTWLDWWRNDQFFMVASLSAYPVVVLHMVVKLLTRGKGIRFKVSSKQTTTTDEEDDKFAELYKVRWVPMMVPVSAVLFFNTVAIGVALGKVVVYGAAWSAKRRTHAALGMLFSVWILILLQPFALAILGRRSKKPNILFVLFPMAFVVIALVYIGVHYLIVNYFPFR